MGLIFRKKINVDNGVGVNIGKNGISSISKRFKWGSISSSGLSLRTGIGGLYHRTSFKNKELAPIISMFLLISIIAYLFWWVVKLLYNLIYFIITTLINGIGYIVKR